jgi:putative FmdB family regulatory protein
MPIYEYYCPQCAKVHEVLQRMSDEPLRHCPVCGSDKVQKMISRAVFQLKGSGWYVTDFKDKKPAKTENKTEENKKESETTATPSATNTEKSTGSDVSNA